VFPFLDLPDGYPSVFSEISGRETFFRLQKIYEMVGNASVNKGPHFATVKSCPFPFSRNFRCADIQAAINRAGIGRDDFPFEPFGQRYGQFRFSGSRWADDCDYF
jgi:hypothetical protein